MQHPNRLWTLLIIAMVLVIGGVVFTIPLSRWGRITLMASETITVTGTAKKEEATQIATFSIGASSVSDDKQKAIAEVNAQVDDIVQKVQDFGIVATDIKTQNLSIYQDQESYTEGGSQRYRPGQWRASNNVEIKLRDVTRATELFNLLAQSGLTNIYGPNFTVDDTSDAEISLLNEAVENARQKADALAESSGKKVVSIISISEGVSNNAMPFARLEGAGGGGAGISPGTNTIYTQVTVTFEVD